MKLLKLEQLAQKKVDEAIMPGSPSVERAARKWFDTLAAHLYKVDRIVHGDQLNMRLQDGGFKKTEADAFIKAWDKFQAEFDELKMAMLISFDENDGR